jgi:uncharacterized protein YggL (DUF469 family)
LKDLQRRVRKKLKVGELRYLSGGQNKNKDLFWNKILF